jgi:hypothetical protein
MLHFFFGALTMILIQVKWVNVLRVDSSCTSLGNTSFITDKYLLSFAKNIDYIESLIKPKETKKFYSVLSKFTRLLRIVKP